jgi:hypothetical protein
VNFSSVMVLSFLGGLMIMWLSSLKKSRTMGETLKQGEASDEYRERCLPESVAQVSGAEQ